MPQKGIKGILLPLLLWLPATFAFWYFCGPLLAMLVAGLLDLLLPLLTGGHITQVVSVGDKVQAVVVLGAGTYTGFEVPAGQTAELLIQSRPMIFSYGMPVFLALAFSADARFAISRALLGLCVLLLLLVTAFGVGMDLVKSVFLSLPADLTRFSLSPMQADLLALGYQLSVLILPLVLPVLLGSWLCASWFRSALLQSSERTALE